MSFEFSYLDLSFKSFFTQSRYVHIPFWLSPSISLFFFNFFFSFFGVGESSWGRRVEWPLMDKFEKVNFVLRLSATKQEHKFLLLSNPLDELYTHSISFVIQQIPHIQSASYGYNPRIHKVINDLPDYALIKNLKAAAMEKKNVEQENKRAEGIWRQTKAQR